MTSGTTTAFLSPSLSTGDKSLGHAYEVKFLLREELAQEVESRLLQTLLPDPHSDPVLGGMYAITSLGCDTPNFGSFHRDPALRNRKFRIRRYGQSEAVFLERKRSRQGRVRKRRTPATLPDLAAIANGLAPHASQSWFLRDISALDITPVCRVRYLRRALFGACDEGPIRVTFDRNIRGSLARAWSLDLESEERPLLSHAVICEFKFLNAMPAPLKAIIADLQLQPTGNSKYRACVHAFASELGITLPIPASESTSA